MAQAFTYHTNHLGSSSWITDALGDVNQHLQQLPYGEEFIDQRQGSFDARYQFTGKERDQMTGYQYFGARYYNSDISVWLSVDPMAIIYPSTSPYSYVENNPVNFIDPNGMHKWPDDDEFKGEYPEVYNYVNKYMAQYIAENITIRNAIGTVYDNKVAPAPGYVIGDNSNYGELTLATKVCGDRWTGQDLDRYFIFGQGPLNILIDNQPGLEAGQFSTDESYAAGYYRGLTEGGIQIDIQTRIVQDLEDALNDDNMPNSIKQVYIFRFVYAVLSETMHDFCNNQFSCGTHYELTNVLFLQGFIENDGEFVNGFIPTTTFDDCQMLLICNPSVTPFIPDEYRKKDDNEYQSMPSY